MGGGLTSESFQLTIKQKLFLSGSIIRSEQKLESEEVKIQSGRMKLKFELFLPSCETFGFKTDKHAKLVLDSTGGPRATCGPWVSLVQPNDELIFKNEISVYHLYHQFCS